MAYEFDIFLSYPRGGAIGAWVKDIFYPHLRDRYPDECSPRHGGVFFDEEMERGGQLPDRLASAIGRSAVMVAVWSPRYFASDWCTAEWRSMRAREAQFKLGQGSKPALLYPVVYGDGDDFPPEAKSTLQQRCFKRFAHLDADATGDVSFNALRREVIHLCEDLGRWVQQAPTWQDDFPVESPMATQLPFRNPGSL